MGVAADCAYVATYGSQEKAATQILTNWNSASSLYKVCWTLLFNCWNFHLIYIQSTFNVSLGIAELEVRDQTLVSVNDSQNKKNITFSIVVQTPQTQAFPGIYPAIQQGLIHVCPYSHNGGALGAMTIWVCGT
jgi:hypothetical protein